MFWRISAMPASISKAAVAALSAYLTSESMREAWHKRPLRSRENKDWPWGSRSGRVLGWDGGSTEGSGMIV